MLNHLSYPLSMSPQDLDRDYQRMKQVSDRDKYEQCKKGDIRVGRSSYTVNILQHMYVYLSGSEAPYNNLIGLSIVKFTLYTVQCTLYTVHCTLYTVHCTMYTVQCTLVPKSFNYLNKWYK